MNDADQFEVRQQSETSVVVYFGKSIDTLVLHKITNFNRRLHHLPFDGLLETVPAYVSLTVLYNPGIVKASATLRGDYAFQRVVNYLHELFAAGEPEGSPGGKFVRNSGNVVGLDTGLHTGRNNVIGPIEIPVCYGGPYGPDLEEVANFNNISIEEVIRLHSQTVYTVYMIGFLPGFPYLGGMNKAIATPRRSSPRKMVPPGSVGIAGEQTGIYPLQSPGGWQLIGRTPTKLFDTSLEHPAFLYAGAIIKFSVISASQFLELSNSYAD
jgi:inhibitor of KinA